MIYIDPPYNTGSDFVYEDSYAQSTDDYIENSGQVDSDGNRLVANPESNGRFHTDWLNMMYPRLRIAKDFLSDEGIIFISIDDNEVDNLRKICDEIFGESNFVSCIIWLKNYAAKNNSQGIPSTTEYLVAYSRSPNWTPNRLPRTEEMNQKYKNPDNDVAPWRSDNPCAPGASTHQGMVYAIQNPFNGELMYPYTGACWRYQQDDLLKIMEGWSRYKLVDLHDEARRAEVCGISTEMVRKGVKSIILADTIENSKKSALAVLNNGPWPKYFFTKNGKGGIARKTYLTDVEGKLVTSFWPHTEVGHTDGAKKEIKALFDGQIPFDTPKPVSLIERMLEIATGRNDLVLDFFSGSATTAQAVLEINKKDSGNRHYILVQLPESTNNTQYKTIFDIGADRIRRAGKKILEENKANQSDTADNAQAHKLDVGFRVLKLASSNMKDVYYKPSDVTNDLFARTEDNIKEDRTDEDLLFQVMLELAVPLSAKIKSEEICGRKVMVVDDNYLIACFDRDITDEVVTAIAKRKPQYFVMRDSSAMDDSVITNFETIFQTYSKDTVRKIL